MNDIDKLRVFYKLKSTYRFAHVDDRHESSAEHTWSCLILADYFLTKFSQNIDRLKVYELLMYHDVVEIETGDIPINPSISSTDKKIIESASSKIISQKLPSLIDTKYLKLFNEFLDEKTIEAKFAVAIDALDAEIHELDYKEDWTGWSKDFLLNKKLHLFDDFPDMQKMFLEIVQFLVENKYFD